MLLTSIWANFHIQQDYISQAAKCKCLWGGQNIFFVFPCPFGAKYGWLWENWVTWSVAKWWWSLALSSGQPWESKLTIVVTIDATPKLSQIPTIRQFGKNIPKRVQATIWSTLLWLKLWLHSETQVSKKLEIPSLERTFYDSRWPGLAQLDLTST